MSQEIATKGPSAIVGQYRDDFAQVLPTHIKPDTWVRLAQGIFRRDEKLAAIAQRNPGSVMVALLECARLGHEPGTDAFYLVPIGGEVEGWESYRGLIQRMYRAGRVVSVKAEVVRENDQFEFDPNSDDFPRHEIDHFGERGAIKGAYAYARNIDGSYSRVEVIGPADIAATKAASRGSSSPSSPWVKWEKAMVLKTVVKRLEPWVTTSTEWITDQLRAAQKAAKPLPHHAQPAPPASVTTDDGRVYEPEVIEEDWSAATADQEPGGSR